MYESFHGREIKDEEKIEQIMLTVLSDKIRAISQRFSGKPTEQDE